MNIHTSPAAREEKRRCSGFLADERGAGLLEYVILAGMVALAATIGFRAFGNRVNSKIIDQASALESISTPVE